MKLFSALFFVLLYTGTQAQDQIKLNDSIPALPVLDQGNSPNCWVFATNSLFESDLLRTQHKKIDLSILFFVRHAYVDKIDRFLAAKGKIFIDGGGQLHDLVRVIDKHGILPEEVYPDKYQHSTNQDALDASIKKITNQFLTQEKIFLDKKDLKEVNDTLDKYCGKLPATFMYNKKKYTAKTFAKKIINFKNNYVELIAFSDLPLYKLSILKDKYNWASDSFYNVTINDMKMLLDTALHKGWSVEWEGGVLNGAFNNYQGYAKYDSLPENLDEQRLTDFENLKTERDHSLHIVGEGLDSENKKWYYVKNSWGTGNRLKGYLFMDENYFKIKTVIVYVNKEGLPLELKRKLGLIEKKQTRSKIRV